MLEKAGGSAFVFITTDPRDKPTREAIKVHVLRRRRQRPDRGYDCRGRLPAPSEPAHSGGEFHIWDFAAAAEGPNPSVTKTTRTAPHHHNDDKAGPALESRVTSLGDDPARGYCEVVTSPSLSPGDSDDLLAHYYVLDGGGSEVPRKLLRHYKLSDASFTAFLAISLSRYGAKRDVVRSRLDAQEKEIQALEEVAKQIALSPAAPAVGTMLAVALLANLQELRNEPGLAEWHWTGLQRMVDVGGGLDRLEMDEEMHTYFFWLDALVCNATVVPLGRHMSSSPPADFSTMIHRPQPPEPSLELTRLLERIISTGSSPSRAGTLEAAASTLLSRVLRRPGLSQDAYTVMKSFRAKLACLLYFSSLKLQYTTSSPRITVVYQTIAQEVERRERGYSVQPEELYYIILASSQLDGLRQLIYAVSRLIHAAKNLERHDCQVVTRILSTFTGHPDPFDDSNEISSDWQDLRSRLSTVTKPFG